MDRNSTRNLKGRFPPTNYLSRRVQYRLMVLVTLFMGTLLLMIEAGKPENWRWMWRVQSLDYKQTSGSTRVTERREVNTRLPVQSNLSSSRPPDVFIALRNTDDLVPEDVEFASSGVFPGVNIAYLETIEDDRVLRGAERQAWFHLLDILKRQELIALENASEGAVGFLQVFEQPQSYRGHLVDISGTVYSAQQVKAPANDYGIDGYVTCWIRPSGANSPINIYVLQLPSGFPTGTDLRENVQFTGFFFKRLAYPAHDGSRTAPLLLAKTVRWTRSEPSVSGRFDTMSTPKFTAFVAISVFGTAAIAISVATIVYWSSRRVRPSHAFTTVTRATPEQIDQLQDTDVAPIPSEFLKRLGEDAKTED